MSPDESEQPPQPSRRVAEIEKLIEAEQALSDKPLSREEALMRIVEARLQEEMGEVPDE